MKLITTCSTRAEILAEHTHVVRHVADGRDVWMPTFNYNFCVSGEMNVGSTPSQVGPISEHFRAVSAWRTPVPVFSFCGDGIPAAALEPCKGRIDPFDEGSAFGQLVARDGIVLFYGAPFKSATLIHHAERSAGGPLYRYDKTFPGTVFQHETGVDVQLLYHVRPQGLHLDYAWANLENEAIAKGVLRPLDNQARVSWASARDLHDLWLSSIIAEPLALLDEGSRARVEPRLMDLGRRFELGDFE
jgi:aminoglycoside N3'-acetyltransferase